MFTEHWPHAGAILVTGNQRSKKSVPSGSFHSTKILADKIQTHCSSQLNLENRTKQGKHMVKGTGHTLYVGGSHKRLLTKCQLEKVKGDHEDT